MGTVKTKNGFSATNISEFYIVDQVNNCDGKGWTVIKRKHIPHWYLAQVCKHGLIKTKRMYEFRPNEKDLRTERVECSVVHPLIKVDLLA